MTLRTKNELKTSWTDNWKSPII